MTFVGSPIDDDERALKRLADVLRKNTVGVSNWHLPSQCRCYLLNPALTRTRTRTYTLYVYAVMLHVV